MASTPINRVTALAVAFAVTFSVFAPGAIGIAAAAGNQPGAGNQPDDGVGNVPLSIGVHQGAGPVVIAVSHEGAPVENATVTVTADKPYEGAGTYSPPNGTDSAGILRIVEPEANKTVNVTITAEKDGLTGEVTVTIRGNNGVGPGFIPRGIMIASFVDSLQASGSITGIGPYISSFIHAQDPSGQSSAGPGQGVGPAKKPTGPPEHAGPPDDNGQGPPDHAGPKGNNGGGPPDHAGPKDRDRGGGPGQNGNGGNK